VASAGRARFRRVAVPFVVVLTAMAAVLPGAWAATTTTTRVSVTSGGAQAQGDSYDPAISASGRFVAFASTATNLAANDLNVSSDIFVRDRREGRTRRVSVSTRGAESNGDSAWPSISKTGRFVAFESGATNLVGGDTNGVTDIFVRDRETGVTRRVSRSTSGREANGGSSFASISADGRFVAFSSEASNLVPGDDNGVRDVFVRNLETGATRRVSVSSAGTPSNGASYSTAISADGRFVAFDSAGSNLIGTDQNAYSDIFVRDRERGTTRRVSVGYDGVEGNGDSGSVSISADGRFVAYASDASNLVGGEDTNGFQDVFVRDRTIGITSRVSTSSAGIVQGNAGSNAPSISANGRFVAFASLASSLVGGEDTNGYRDVFMRDRRTGTTVRISMDATTTTQGNGDSYRSAISADGRFVAFESSASSLVVGDTNGDLDLFLRGPLR